MTDIERIFHAWHDHAKARAIEALAALYAEDAVFESPLVAAVLGQGSEPVLRGRAAILAFMLRGAQGRPDDLLKWYRTGEYFTNGRTLIWEYPRETPEGEQIDVVEVMEIAEGLIAAHRVYFGSKGCARIAPLLAG
ncbi:nuclear transport factor 2 family protein [Stakelama tenebrarum]|uniref:Nuclear transport factor 2 family protein n=1 Tax=Stakelama tenebrarum TaxID=2711215 RepID=A0A6G6Y738_9SPHN|nr:nuclear transport factor 2 family protein [Sphingosinithalassobacter tenebrarum]QIG80730.1 nuclear transport factor 2 family protein [Sphingosinithalassobacter tenebrarum]